MNTQLVNIKSKKNIALVAHDNKKKDLLRWVNEHRNILVKHNLFATGTTGTIIKDNTELDVTIFKSGPLGGDQQIGAKIVESAIDCLIFFWDPLEAQPHDPDVKALLRISTLYDIPVATNKSTADFIFTSPLINEEYVRTNDNFTEHTNRNIQL